MRYRLGTMGFSYREWVGTFYPRQVPSSRWLEWYAERFDTVELDTTFYAAPTERQVKSWASRVPDDFRFCCKMPRAVTHEGAIQQNVETMHAFVETARCFEAKLGPVLIQFPQSFGAENLGGLLRFCDALPQDVRFAVEIREHRLFHSQALRQGLVDRRVCLTTAEYEQPPEPFVRTTDFLYVRLLGVHDRYPEKNHLVWDPTPNLAYWADVLQTESTFTKVAVVTLNNGYAGYSVAAARRLADLLGLPRPEVAGDRTDARVPGQGLLFDAE